MQVDPQKLILWSDETLLVINKPAGLPTLTDGYNPQSPYLGGVLTPIFERLWTVHRLDRHTSGVIVMARTREAHRILNNQFEQRRVTKIYHALVNGNPSWDEKTVKLPLRPNGDRKHRTVVDPHRGKPAHTDFRVLERFKEHALVEGVPHTGRTHQIRVHLAAQGSPIVGDALYGGGEGLFFEQLVLESEGEAPAQSPFLIRLGLHARSLAFEHPVTGELLRFEAPYAEDFEAALRALRAVY